MASPSDLRTRRPKMIKGSKDNPKITNIIVKGPIYNKLATRVYKSK